MSYLNLACWVASSFFALSLCKFQFRSLFSKHFPIFYFLLFTLPPVLRIIFYSYFDFSSLELIDTSDFFVSSLIYWLFIDLTILIYFLSFRWRFKNIISPSLARFLAKTLFPLVIFQRLRILHLSSIVLVLPLLLFLSAIMTLDSRSLVLGGVDPQSSLGTSSSFIAGLLSFPSLFFLYFLLEVKKYRLSLVYILLLVPYYILSGSKGFIAIVCFNCFCYLRLRSRLPFNPLIFVAILLALPAVLYIGALSRVVITNFGLSGTLDIEALSYYTFNPAIAVTSLNRYNSLDFFIVALSKYSVLLEFVPRFLSYFFQAPLPSILFPGKELNPCWQLCSTILPSLGSQCIAPGFVGGAILFLGNTSWAIFPFIYAIIFRSLSAGLNNVRLHGPWQNLYYPLVFSISISVLSVLLEGTIYNSLPVLVTVIFSLIAFRIIAFSSRIITLSL